MSLPARILRAARRRIHALDIPGRAYAAVNLPLGWAMSLASWNPRLVSPVAKRLPRPLRNLSYTLFGGVVRWRPSIARQYLVPGLDVPRFFDELNRRGISYVVLRWFEDLPAVDPGEDIDLLIADADHERIRDLITPIRAGQALDVYSESGIGGFAFRKLPYFPPRLARSILASGILLRGRYRVPDPLHHALSMAYHAVFHKGSKAGVPWSGDASSGGGEHDYPAVLADLTAKAGISCPITLEGLHGMLSGRDWVPSVDLLRKLAEKGDPWLLGLLPESPADNAGALIVFVVRRRAMELGMLPGIREQLRRRDIEIIAERILDPAGIEELRLALRGGRWDRGPFAVDGGPPAAVVACYDHNPDYRVHQLPGGRSWAENRTGARIKEEIRRRLTGRSLRTRWFNPLHSADDTYESEFYARLAFPAADLARLHERMQVLQTAFRTTQPVLRAFPSKRRRAKVEIIAWQGGTAVKKTFKAGCERFCEREVFAIRHFAPLSSCLPELYDAGPNHLICRHYDDLLAEAGPEQRRRMLAGHAAELVAFLRLVHAEGYALIDFNPGSVILPREGGLKVVDFEFLQRYEGAPGPFSASYDVIGPPPGFAGDVPQGKLGAATIARSWKGIIPPEAVHD